MAISTNYAIKSNTKVFIGTEVTMGTACLDNGTWHQVDVTDFTIAEATAPLEMAPQKSGLLTQGEADAKHAIDKQLFEIELQFNGSVDILKRIASHYWGDGTTVSLLTGDAPPVKKYEHNVTNAVPVTLYFFNGGSDGVKDLVYKSCMMTGLDMNFGLSDGGVLKCVAKFMTAYSPIEQTSNEPDSATSTTGTPLNFHDMTMVKVATKDLLMSDFSLSINRPVNVTAFDIYANPKVPAGYSLGSYEVTGSFTCKRDSESIGIPLNTSTGNVIIVHEDTSTNTAKGFVMNDAIIESASTTTADPAWNTTFNYRAYYSGTDSSTTILTLDLGTE